jgi:hypothetical protein
MKKSGDLVIGRSGDRKGKLTAAARRRGDNRVIEETTVSAAFSAPPRLRGEVRYSYRPITRFLHLIHAALREIFDESAYDRFLLRTSASRSVASYRDFMRDRETAMAKKPRCC